MDGKYAKPKKSREKVNYFDSPRAHSKKSFHQVNGETEQSQHNQILDIQTRKRVPFR